MKLLKRQGLWLVFAGFVLAALFCHPSQPLFLSQGPYPLGKMTVWLIFLGFLFYSIYCSTQENIFKTIKTLYPFHWARQIGIDLYLGLLITLAIIYFNEGSLLMVALWLVPLLLFANLASLLYIALHYDMLMAHVVRATM